MEERGELRQLVVAQVQEGQQGHEGARLLDSKQNNRHLLGRYRDSRNVKLLRSHDWIETVTRLS